MGRQLLRLLPKGLSAIDTMQAAVSIMFCVLGWCALSVLQALDKCCPEQAPPAPPLPSRPAASPLCRRRECCACGGCSTTRTLSECAAENLTAAGSNATLTSAAGSAGSSWGLRALMWPCCPPDQPSDAGERSHMDAEGASLLQLGVQAGRETAAAGVAGC